MGGDKQIQKAGDNSQQMQAGTVNITNIVGIDEKRAREIFNEMYAIARKDFTQDAYECANERVARFEESLMPKMLQINGALEKFADPSFQFLMTEAHKTAAATERVADYDLLSELLVHRVKKGESRKVRAGITRAVEIVDQIDDDALCALTVVHTVEKLLPVSDSVVNGLNTLETIFEKLIYTKLPEGREWLDHLEILDAVRLTTFGSLKKTIEFYSEQLNGYVCVGIAKETENYNRALSMLRDNNLPEGLLNNHELMEGYVRLPVSNKQYIDSLQLMNTQIINGQVNISYINLSSDQKAVLQEIYGLYDNSEELKKKVVENFTNEWKKRKALMTLCDWWDNIPVLFDITAVGTVLAHANAQRCDKSIPPLE